MANNRLKAFVAVVGVFGCAAIAHSVSVLPATPEPADWLLLTVLAIATAVFPVQVPGVPVMASVSETFLFTMTVLVGPAPAVVAGAIDGLVISLRRPHRLDQRFFNVANPALAMWIAGQVAIVLTGGTVLAGAAEVDTQHLVVTLAILAAVYFAINSGLTATAAALERRESPWALWRRHLNVFAITFIASAAAAFFLVLLTQLAGVVALTAVLPIVGVVHLALRSRFDRVADAEAHVKAVDRLYLSTIEAMSTAIEAKDGITSTHIRRVQAFATALAGRLQVRDPNELKALEAASLLHDTGKLAVPEHILNKPGKLNADEQAIMRRHVDVGADILTSIDFPYPVVPIVRAHHENWDGTGYPRGLKGAEIPIGARILSVVDCYDALTSDRPYRAAMTREQAVAILVERRGNMYDPDVVDGFLKLLPSLTIDEAQHPPHMARAVQSIQDAAALESQMARAEAPPPALTADLALDVGASTLQSLQRVVHGSRQPADVARLVVTSIRPVVPAAAYVLYTSSSCGRRLVGQVVGSTAIDAAQVSFEIGERLTGWVASHRQQIVNSDARLDLGDAAAVAGVRHCVATPLLAGDRVAGVLSVYGAEPFSDAHAVALTALAPFVAMAMSVGAASTGRPELKVVARA